MKEGVLKSLPVFYQNMNVQEVNDKGSKKKSPNYIRISVLQTAKHEPVMLYKPVSKICIPEDDE